MDKDGLTCRTCLTLNPVGAPACVRCNNPLPVPDAPLVQPATGAAGAAPPWQALPSPPPPSVAPQPPPQGWPPQSGPVPAPPPGGRSRRRVLLVGNLVVLLILVAGGLALWVTRPHYLDTGAVATTIGGQLDATVHCPAKERRRAGTTFSCSVIYPGDRHGTVRVTVRNDNGDYRWSASGATR